MNNARSPKKNNKRATPKIRSASKVSSTSSLMVAENVESTTEVRSTIVPLQFEHIRKDCDVSTFTGFHKAKMFEAVFHFVKHKAKLMTYWSGSKYTSRVRKRASTVETAEAFRLSTGVGDELYPIKKSGPERKLSLEQEFLVVMMKLRLSLLVDDLAFRFGVSSGRISQIVITWVKLLSKELEPLLIWPSRNKIRGTLSDCFKRLHPKVRTIIDCSEIFFDTPSALDVQSCMWSDYKHHCTVKFLVAITPNGAITWISPLYGGRASDIHIVRDSGFLKKIGTIRSSYGR